MMRASSWKLRSFAIEPPIGPWDTARRTARSARGVHFQLSACFGAAAAAPRKYGQCCGKLSISTESILQSLPAFFLALSHRMPSDLPVFAYAPSNARLRAISLL